MKPTQFARQECANLEHDGACAGIGICDEGSPYSFGRKPKCVLGDGKRCRYFEECLLPMGIELINARNVTISKERDEARKLYRQASAAPIPGLTAARLCPQCRNRTLERAKQLCYVCREDNRKSKLRERVRRHRTDDHM